VDIPPDSRVIGVVAPWAPRHRVKEAIWSFDLIRAVRSDVHLVIAGEGPRRGELEAFRDSQDCAGVIHFVGPRELPPDWLEHCDMLWSSDPGPRVAYATWRAAASGVPVIAVDTPAHRAKLTSGETGMLIPVAVRPAAPQATLQLFDDTELRQRIASNAREEFGGRYSGAVTAAGIVAVLAGQS
jgi:glycosyltransferase involved in cell wall biosynthesis